MRLPEFNTNLQKLSGVVFDMERRGVCVDLEVAADIGKKASQDEEETRKRLDAFAGDLCGCTETNWNYHGWLAPFLFDPRPTGLGIEPSEFCSKGRVKDDKLTTDGTALDYLASLNPEYRDLLNLIRKLRQQHRVANYARSWAELAIHHGDGSFRLHPSFGMANDTDTRPGAKTGRFGIKNPPLQQVPNDPRKDPYRLRRAFIAPPGYVLVVADYSQLEIVIMAHLCYRLFGATGLRDRLYPGKPDMHSATAKYVFGDTLHVPEVEGCLDLGLFKVDPILKRFRDLVKRIRYGLAYGKGDYGFGNTLFELDADGNIIGPPIGQEKAGVFRNALLDMDPEVRQFQEWVWDYGYEHEMFPSLLGRWDPGPVIRERGWKGEPSNNAKRKYRQWENWAMQAGGQEIVFMVMIALAEAGLTQSLQVHDELHFWVRPEDVDRDIPRIQEIGENTIKLDAPLIFKPHAGETWEGCK